MTNLSLRERKRRSTWAGLHEAAAQLALSHDALSNVTIEAIAAHSEVSVRTFFNYFHSKEHAVLGLHKPVITAELREAFAQSTAEPLRRVADLFVDAILSTRAGGESRQWRQQNYVRHPELIGVILNHTSHIEALVTETAIELFSEPPEHDHLSQREYVEVLVYACSAAHRLAFRRAVASGEFGDDRIEFHRALDHLEHIMRGR